MEDEEELVPVEEEDDSGGGAGSTGWCKGGGVSGLWWSSWFARSAILGTCAARGVLDGGGGAGGLVQKTMVLGLVMVLASAQFFGYANAMNNRKLFGDKCNASRECSFDGSVCNLNEAKTHQTCRCVDDLPVTNHIDKCGKQVKVNETCIFNEQCESLTEQTECKDGVCTCLFEQTAILKSDGTMECVAIKNTLTPQKYIDPAMIGILVAMFLMFITICVVLRLFSRARWRENRTIFNTPNPRLMNVSLLRDNKLLHERRGSRASQRGPSRQPSMASLRPNSPGSSQPGSRRGSRGSSAGSATSTRSNNKSPTRVAATAATHHHHPNAAASQPMLESVTIEVQEHK